MKNTRNLLIILIIAIIIIIISLYVVINIISKQEDEMTSTNTAESNDAKFEKNVASFGLNIEEMPLDLEEKIPEYEDFLKKLKEYAGLQGLVDYGDINLEFIEEKQDGDILKLKFKVQDNYKTKLIAEINVKQNTYEFYDYR